MSVYYSPFCIFIEDFELHLTVSCGLQEIACWSCASFAVQVRQTLTLLAASFVLSCQMDLKKLLHLSELSLHFIHKLSHSLNILK